MQKNEKDRKLNYIFIIYIYIFNYYILNIHNCIIINKFNLLK